MKWGRLNLFGSMPCALAIHGKTLYVCNGGDNALCEIDLTTGRVRGFRPAGYYPVQVALDGGGHDRLRAEHQGQRLCAPHREGTGRATRTTFREPSPSSTSTADLKQATAAVAANNHWNRDSAALRPNLAVYNGAIKHVLYIIKENRTYDEVFGDMKAGQRRSRSSATLGETITPNHHALARQFTLFDNGYVSGTNSADGHAWCTQALANDYLEHFYTGYRTYPDDGDCAMALSHAGGIWDAALKKGKTLRIYGEFCDDELATFTPKPKNWLEVWEDRINGPHKIKIGIDTRVAQHPQVHAPAIRLLAPAAERSGAGRPVHRRVPADQPGRYGPEPDGHEPALRPYGRPQSRLSQAAVHGRRQRSGAGPHRGGGLATARSGKTPASS